MAIRAMMLACLLAFPCVAARAQDLPLEPAPDDALDRLDISLSRFLQRVVDWYASLARSPAGPREASPAPGPESRPMPISGSGPFTSRFDSPFGHPSFGDVENMYDLLRRATAHERAGRHREAEAGYQSAIRSAAADPSGEMVLASSLGHLARLLNAQGRSTEAEPYARRGFLITETHRGESPWISYRLDAMRTVARTEERLGRLGAALELAADELTLAEASYGPSSRQAADALVHRCWLEEKARQFDRALETSGRVLAIVEAERDERRDARIVDQLERMARLQFLRGAYAETDALLERASKILAAAPWQDAAALRVAEARAVTKLALNKPEEAEPLLRAVLRERERQEDAAGKGLAYLADLTNMTSLCFSLGRDAEAVRYGERALAIYRQQPRQASIRGEELNVLKMTATACERVEKLREAEDLYLETLARLEASAPRDYRREFDALGRYAEFLRNVGRTRESVEIRLQAEAALRKAFESEEPI